MPRPEQKRKIVLVWTPSHVKNPALAPLKFIGVRRIWWGYGTEGAQSSDLVLNQSHVVAISIQEVPD